MDPFLQNVIKILLLILSYTLSIYIVIKDMRGLSR